MNKVVLKAKDLDGSLTAVDQKNLSEVESAYTLLFPRFQRLASGALSSKEREREENAIIQAYTTIGSTLKEICSREDRIWVYPFCTPAPLHAEASRIIAKLRDTRTGKDEFVYYCQRAYEMLSNLAFISHAQAGANHLIVRTPVTEPAPAFAVHKIPNIDALVADTVMCVMLRGALLPSMIVSKEIEEYSSGGHVSPFALFRIKRADGRDEGSLEYVLDLERSYFSLSDLDNKHLIFADPMNATGGSLVTVVSHLLELGVKPKSVKVLNVISALKGALRCVRALPNLDVYTLWMDPLLNEKAYILPGLGDAGDRLNGLDTEESPRNILRLIADYGAGISQLYRRQIAEIEDKVFKH